MNKKTAMMGGSFDPVHLGHLFLLHCAVTLTDYQRFVIVPAFLSNFKQDAKPVADDKQRLEMLKIAIDDYKKIYPYDRDVEIVISDTELKRKGISYTSDTIDELMKLYDLEKLGLIMGDDHVLGLRQWHNFDLFKHKVEFLICRRGDNDHIFDCLSDDINYKKLEPDFTQPQSSTAIRNNLEQFEDYLSQGVLDYVRKNNLYS